MRVLLTHNPEDLEVYFGRALPELQGIAEVVLNPTPRDLTPAELIAAAETCEVIIAHRSTPADAQVFERLPQLLAFLRCAVDISTIDVAAASANGVLVARAEKSFIASTAELALGLFLDLSRNISNSTADYRAGRPPVQRPGHQVRGQTAGVIGHGSIGAYLADLLVALGLRVLVHDPFVTVEASDREQVELRELLERADVVFPLAPGGPVTTNLLGAPELTVMKQGALLVNVSRGELLDETAVAEALDSGRLGGLAMDVGGAEDQRPSPELAGRAGVVATPHLGGLTPENADAQAASSVEQVRALIEGEMPPRAVNADAATRLRDWWSR